MTSQTAREEELARLIASGLGYDFDESIADKAEWITLRGERADRFHDINEPMQCDYIEAANLVLASPIIARIEAEALARGRMEGAKAMQEAAVDVAAHHAKARHQAKDDARKRHAKIEARDYESMAIEGVHIECDILALDPAEVVKGLNDAD